MLVVFLLLLNDVFLFCFEVEFSVFSCKVGKTNTYRQQSMLEYYLCDCLRSYLGHCCGANMFHQDGLFCRVSGGDVVSTTPFLRFRSNLMACHDFRLFFLSAASSPKRELSSALTNHFFSTSSSTIQGSFSWTTCNTSWLIIIAAPACRTLCLAHSTDRT